MEQQQNKAAPQSAPQASAMLPAKLLRYILQSSGLHQIFLLALTVSVFLIEVVPLELQRRIVNDAVKHREFQLIITLCAVYAFCFTYVVFSIVNSVRSMRVSPEVELEGLDIPQFGMEAYPEGKEQVSLA